MTRAAANRMTYPRHSIFLPRNIPARRCCLRASASARGLDYESDAAMREFPS